MGNTQRIALPLRAPDWPSRLAAHFDSRARQPFAWGSHDCCTFAADGVLAMTGADHLHDLRGAYDTEMGAARILARLGGMEQAVSARLGPPLHNVALAQRGDLVLVDAEAGRALAICAGALAIAPGVAGLQRVPIAGWRMAWRV